MNNIDKKLEARIARLERAMSRKNERLSRNESEMSPAEVKAYRSIKDAIKALMIAEEACDELEVDDMWGYNDWDKLGRACETALSYLPEIYTF